MAIRALMILATIFRVDGSKHRKPSPSVTKPGVNNRTAESISSAPSINSTAGDSPPRKAFLMRMIVDIPSERTKIAPRIAVSMIRAMVLRVPMC
ncbi:MAG: hypothetical protein VX986_02165 [Pseudomonadota bacterium]|nr:hypothetical protein [Pseudomonadota bacterium]